VSTMNSTLRAQSGVKGYVKFFNIAIISLLFCLKMISIFIIGDEKWV
jgi:hypothetical protein